MFPTNVSSKKLHEIPLIFPIMEKKKLGDIGVGNVTCSNNYEFYRPKVSQVD